MKPQMKAIELTGVIDEQGKLHIDEPLSNFGVGPVRVILLIPETSEDIGESEWLHAAASNPAFDFLKDSEEDIYTPEEGKTFDKEKNAASPR